MATIQPKSRPVKNTKLKIAIFIALLLFTCFSYYFYQIFQTPNIDTKGRKVYVRIPTGATYDQAMDSVEATGAVVDRLSFRFMGKLMKYDKLVKPGFYEITDQASNYYQ
ncbi:MAG: aminodeoxychorismate lyase, partial [Chryseobacterium sp.]